MTISQWLTPSFVSILILLNGGLAHADVPLLVGQVGGFNVLRQKGVSPSGLVGLEYRGRTQDNLLRPTIGFFMTLDPAAYAYAGYVVDIPVAGSFVFSPNFMIGAYIPADSAYKMGGIIEFKSSVELSWQFDSKSRLGICFGHISNANLYLQNPGEEHLVLNFAYALE